MAGQREVKVAIIGDPSSLQRALRSSESGVASFNNKLQSFGRRMQTFGRTMTTHLTLPLVGFGILAARELSAGARAFAQTEAVIESTGGAAGKSVQDIVDLSAALSELTSLDDEPIQEAANTLLTFQEIAGETFDEATALTLDLSVAMDKDLRSSAVMVGKALNDPIRGLTALTRVGVQFSDQQREQIQLLTFFGDTAGAQQVILQELTEEFGGSAEALGGTVAGRFNRLRNEMENLGAEILENLIPLLEDLAGVAESLADAYDRLSPAQQKWVAWAVAALFVIGPLSTVLGGMVTILGGIGLALGISAGSAFLLIGALAALVGTIIYVAVNWDTVKQAANNAFDNIVNNIPGARALVQGFGTVVKGVHGALVLMGNVTFDALRGTFQALTGDISSALSSANSLLQTLVSIANTNVDKQVVAGSGAKNTSIGAAVGPRNRSSLEVTMERAMRNAMRSEVQLMHVVNQ